MFFFPNPNHGEMAMETTLIRDTEFNTEVAPEDSGDVGRLAAELLDYDAPTDAATFHKSRKEFYAALDKHNIRRPFTRESVENYKRKALNRANRLESCCIIGFIGGVVLGLVLTIPACLGAIHEAWPISFAGLMVVSVIVGMNTSTYSWSQRPLRDYPGPCVPEFALQTAVELKQEFGQRISFWVESLEKNQRPADPFLCAQFGCEMYHLEVWNEPGYRQQREV